MCGGVSAGGARRHRLFFSFCLRGMSGLALLCCLLARAPINHWRLPMFWAASGCMRAQQASVFMTAITHWCVCMQLWLAADMVCSQPATARSGSFQKLGNCSLCIAFQAMSMQRRCGAVCVEPGGLCSPRTARRAGAACYRSLCLMRVFEVAHCHHLNEARPPPRMHRALSGAALRSHADLP